jgi:hypothetical protein
VPDQGALLEAPVSQLALPAEKSSVNGTINAVD